MVKTYVMVWCCFFVFFVFFVVFFLFAPKYIFIQLCQLTSMIQWFRPILLTSPSRHTVASHSMQYSLACYHHGGERLILVDYWLAKCLEQDELCWLRVAAVCSTGKYHYIASGCVVSGNHAVVSGQQTTSGRIRVGSVCKLMHGRYGLLHAPSITACGIAWGLHCKQNSV